MVRVDHAGYTVRLDPTPAGDAVQVRASVRGALRHEMKKDGRHRVVVGDRVRVVDATDDPVIEDAAPRRTKLARRSAGEAAREQVTAANVDRIACVVAARDPEWKPGFVDRVLCAAERTGLPASLIVNKVDLLDEEGRAELAALTGPYEAIGVPVIRASVETGKGVAALREHLRDRISVVSGPSGVGKSSLLNAVQPGLELQTSEVSSFSRKGRHTTTAVTMIPLAFGGYVVDTPGVRAFGFYDLEARELGWLFKDLRPFAYHDDDFDSPRCRFRDCRHVREPGCEVKRAVEEGRLSAARYQSYVRILESLGAPMTTEKKLLKIVNQELDRQNPSWKIIVNKSDWLCPYCGEVGAERLRMQDNLELRITQHLLGCQVYQVGGAEPLDMDTLERRADMIHRRRRIRRCLKKDERWQLRTPDGRWVCPFCASATEEVLGFDPEAKDGEAGRRALDRDVSRTLKHLMRCEPYLEDKRPRPLDQLLAARDKEPRARRPQENVHDRLARDPVWRLRDMDKSWLCPFCAKTTGIAFPREKSPQRELCERVSRHLDRCAAYKRLGGRPRAERYLRDRIIAINRRRILEKLKRKLGSHAIWQITDADDEWYCPYCASPTGVRLPEPRQHGVSDRTLNAVWGHLASCPAYAGRRAQLMSKAVILQAVAHADRQKRLRREVRRGLSTDPRFAVHDAFGSWLCPYCRKVQKRISVSKEGGLLDKTIEQVVTHLAEHCSHYAEGEPPTVSLEDLVSRVQRRPKAEAKPGGGTLKDSDWVRRIDMEVAALKQKVEVTRDLERSLEDARDRQLRLMPTLPEIEGFEFGIVYQPCGRIGGDFYDFFRVSDQELGIAVGDVAGHGIEAALLVGLAKKLIEIHGRERSSPGQTLLLANADIYPDLDARTFVTVFLGVLDPVHRRLRFARAGHNPLILFNAARTPRLQVLDAKGMALGMDSGAVFRASIEEVEVALMPGDLLLQYTDGVTEATNHEKEEFGLERLYAVIERYGAEEAEYLLYQIERAVQDFREGARQGDDVTLVAIKVLA